METNEKLILQWLSRLNKAQRTYMEQALQVAGHQESAKLSPKSFSSAGRRGAEHRST